MTFLVARPKQKAQQTVKDLAVRGLHGCIFPIIEIIENREEIYKQALFDFLNLNTQKILIVTSTYAAKWLTQQVLTINKSQLNIVSIGESTAELISNSPLHKNLQSLVIAKPENSEGALLLPILSGKLSANVCILKGKGGRQLLQTSLQQRGAVVRTLDVYKRKVNTDVLTQYAFEQKEIKCIIATSVEIIDALRSQIFAQQQNWLATLAWIVPSERIKAKLQMNGIKTIYVSQGASSEALAACAAKLVITGVVNV